jgi:hypothetical protein
VADGTHEGHAAFMLCDARVTSRSREWRSALLEFVWLKSDCTIPVGRAPELEPTPFVGVGLPIFAVEDEYKAPAGDDDKTFPDIQPVISAGEARFNTGPLEKVSGSPAVYMLGSLSLHAPGKETVWLGVPVWEPPTRICVQDG